MVLRHINLALGMDSFPVLQQMSKLNREKQLNIEELRFFKMVSHVTNKAAEGNKKKEKKECSYFLEEASFSSRHFLLSRLNS